MDFKYGVLKYGVKISDDSLIKYYHGLIKDFFKILPIFEGRDVKTKSVIYSQEESYNQYKKYIHNFTIEICGAYHIFHEELYFLKLLNILEGMSNSKINDHAHLKSLVFHCIDITKKMIAELEKNGDYNVL